MFLHLSIKLISKKTQKTILQSVIWFFFPYNLWRRHSKGSKFTLLLITQFGRDLFGYWAIQTVQNICMAIYLKFVIFFNSLNHSKQNPYSTTFVSLHNPIIMCYNHCTNKNMHYVLLLEHFILYNQSLQEIMHFDDIGGCVRREKGGNEILKRNSLKSITFSTLLLSHASCKNFKNTPSPDYIFLNQIISAFRILKSRQNRYEIFVSFFDVMGLCWPLYKPHISCNAIARVIWTVNNDHDTTDKPKKLKKIEKNVRKEVKWRMKEVVEDPILFIALNKSKVISSVNKNVFLNANFQKCINGSTNRPK